MLTEQAMKGILSALVAMAATRSGSGPTGRVFTATITMAEVWRSTFWNSGSGNIPKYVSVLQENARSFAVQAT